MDDHFTVLGGWGISPEILWPIFGEESVYIDINNLVASVIADGRLRPDWRECITSYLAPLLTPSRLLAGWSTGAIIAVACASRLDARGLVLFGATPSFCRSAEFRHGMHTSVLRMMRNRLAADPLAVITDFRQQCGLPMVAPPPLPWSAGTLSAGLSALEQISLLDRFDTILPTLVFHGRNDRIIPIAAAEFLCACCGGTLIALDGDHACFINNLDTIKSAMTNFSGGNNHGPF